MSCTQKRLFFVIALIQGVWWVCFGAHIIPVSLQRVADKGSISSPNFPNPYPNLIIRKWNITVSSGRQIKLNFTSFHLASPRALCDTDFVQIQDGGLSSSDVIVRLCGQLTPGKILYSSSRHLQIHFETDAGNSDTGFEAHYEAVELKESFMEELQRERKNCSGMKGYAKECRCVAVESNEILNLKVNCSSLSLSLIPTGDLPSIASLLDLSNNALQKIESANFTGLNRLVLLNLADNKIESVEDGSFSNLIALEIVDLSKNCLQEVHWKMFIGPKYLFILHLAENSIQALDINSFKDIKYLIILDLRENKIEDIAENTFVNQHLLRYLYLEGNEIKRIYPWAKNPILWQLRSWDLSRNRLTDAPGYILSRKPYLTALNLGHNDISEVQSGTFTNLTSLLFLDLSHNKIDVIHPAAFRGASPVVILLLGNNRISSLANGTFASIPKLRYLDLSRNRISEIHAHYFHSLHYLSFVINGFSSQLVRFALLVRRVLTFIHCIGVDFTFGLPDCVRSEYSTDHQRFITLMIDTTKCPQALILNQTQASPSYVKYIEISNDSVNLAYNPLHAIEDGSFLTNTNLQYLNIMFNSMDALWTNLLTGPRNLLVEVAPFKEVVNYELDLPINIESLFTSSGYKCTYKGNSSTSCHPCPLGTFEGAEKECIACPAGGFYQDELAYTGTGCKLCPLGHYVPPHAAPGKAITECVLCPQGTDYARPAGFKGCACLSNFYRLDRFAACSQCPSRGLSCHNESVRLQPGFYWKWSSSESLRLYQQFAVDLLVTNSSYEHITFDGKIPQVYVCPVPEACLGGMESRCSHGYEGPLCAVCSKGHYQLLNRCRKCPKTLWFILQMCGIAIVISVFTASIILARRQRCPSGRPVSDMILARLKIVIGFYQATSGTLNTFSYVAWPSALLTVMQYANVIQLNLLQIIPLQCFVENLTIDAYTRFLIIVGSNVTILLVTALVYYLRKRVLVMNRDLTEDELTECISCIKAQTYRIVCLVIFVTYPWTCNAIFQLLSPTCQQICSRDKSSSCQYFLRADFTVQCFTDKFNKYTIPVYLLLATVAVVPGLILLLLWKYHHRKIYPSADVQSYNGREISIGLSFLYENYAPSCWFWEVIEVVRKVWLTSTIYLMGAETRSHLGAAAVASGIYCILVAYYKPISDRFEHWLQLMSLMACFVTMKIGMLLKITTEEASSSSVAGRDSIFVSVVLVAVNVIVIGIMVVQYISTLITAIKRLRTNPRCGAECCVSFITQIIGAGEDATDIDTAEIPASVVQLRPTSVK